MVKYSKLLVIAAAALVTVSLSGASYAAFWDRAPKKQEAEKQRGKKQEAKKEYAALDRQLLSALEELSEKDSAFSLRAWYLAADGYERQGDIDAAVGLLKAAVKIFPKQSSEILNRTMSLYQRQSNLDKIEETAKALQKDDPDNITYQESLASACFLKGEKDKGIAIMQGFAKSHPENFDAQLRCAQVLQGVGMQQEALKYFDTAAKIKPTDTWIKQQSVSACLAAGKPDKAALELKELIKLDPKNTSYSEQLADAYSRSGQKGPAIREYEALLAVAKDDAKKAEYQARIDQLKQSPVEQKDKR